MTPEIPDGCYPSGLTPETVHLLFGLGLFFVLVAALGAVVTWAAAVSALRSALRLYIAAEQVVRESRR